jgi:potassium inwardly-rectifying channel subfamily J
MVRGEVYFLNQIVELRKHNLLEAHVRMYAVRRHQGMDGSIQPFQLASMRLVHPDDQTNSMIILNLPNVLIHRVDAWSPLRPPTTMTPANFVAQRHSAFPNIFQRAGDAEAGARNNSSIGTSKGGEMTALTYQELSEYWREVSHIVHTAIAHTLACPLTTVTTLAF